MQSTVALIEIVCAGCKCGEVIPLRRSGSQTSDNDPELALGYRQVRIRTSGNGDWILYFCPRCQNNLVALDYLRVGIELEVKYSYGSLKAIKLAEKFTDFNESEVNEIAYKLIERGIIQVDEKGILSLVKNEAQ